MVPNRTEPMYCLQFFITRKKVHTFAASDIETTTKSGAAICW